MAWGRYGYTAEPTGQAQLKQVQHGHTAYDSRVFGSEITRNVVSNNNTRRKRSFNQLNCEQKEEEEVESYGDRPTKRTRYNLRSRTQSQEALGVTSAAIAHGQVHAAGHAAKYQRNPTHSNHSKQLHANANPRPSNAKGMDSMDTATENSSDEDIDLAPRRPHRKPQQPQQQSLQSQVQSHQSHQPPNPNVNNMNVNGIGNRRMASKSKQNALAVCDAQNPVRRSARIRNKRAQRVATETNARESAERLHLPDLNEVEVHTVDEVIVEEPEVLECDEPNRGDDLYATDYVEDIIGWYRSCEAAQMQNRLIRANYISSQFQPDLNEHMRCILLNWLNTVHRRFQLSDRTLFLGVYIFDAYLSSERVQRAELQLIGCCCIWIASKYHEIYAPEANDFAYIADHSFDVAQLFKIEIQIITKLKFRFADIITPLHFAERFMQIALFPLQKKYKDRGTAKALRDGQRYTDLVRHLTSYLIELSLFDCKIVSTRKPSIVAAATLCFTVLSIQLYGRWPDFLAKATGYSYADLKPVLKRINELRRKACSKDDDKFNSVKKKHPTIVKWLDRLNINAAVRNKSSK